MWEGRRREASPYPDLCPLTAIRRRALHFLKVGLPMTKGHRSFACKKAIRLYSERIL